jgi:DNA-binding NarL/FixJ family response regulator
VLRIFTHDVTALTHAEEATAELAARGSDAAVVLLTMHAEDGMVRRAVDAGAKAYVLKGSIVEDLLLAIRVAATGGIYLVPEAALSSEEPEPGTPRPVLTPRETEVLRLIGDGLTNRAVASKLSISVKTVERHRTSIMAKLDAHSVVELMRAAFRHGFLDLES